MEADRNQWIAACGLDCEACEIRRAPFDAKAAESVIGWFRSQGWLGPDEGVDEVLERKMICKGCRGDRSVHWSANCWILQCCVDDKGLETCAACDDFPCDRLVTWAASDPEYAAAVDRLRTMRG